MWHQLKNRLGQYPSKPHTVEELEKRINIEWYKFTKEDCLKYIDSMPGRIEAVIKSKGQQEQIINFFSVIFSKLNFLLFNFILI
jgi:hypothetical protein